MAKLAVADDLSKRLDHLRTNRPVVNRDDMLMAVEEVVASMTGPLSLNDIKLYREIEDLARFIQAAKREIAAIRPDDIKGEHIPAATDELDAVVAATAHATGEILDRAEALDKLAGSGTLPPEATAEINDAVTRIFEASNFQDITGQRITKVVRTLRFIESKIDGLLVAFGTSFLAELPPPEEPPQPQGDAALLHGPQMPAAANSQADIDAILAGLF
jgi:chemotaxis protein CheZ